MDELEGLVERMRQDDRAAYEVLLDRFQPAVFRLAHRVTGNREDAWDVVQDVFLAVHTKRDELREVSRFRPWLYRMAYCRAVDMVRARGGRAAPAGDDFLASAAPASAGPTHVVEAAALTGEVGRALAALPERFREPLVLATHGDLTYEQIAGELGCPVGTVRSRIATARQLLRERLAAWFGVN
ncbi:MAG: sigma-70 family RNA polymerase sigma factor [Candidatus Wallbacteria bacterium]|nr:sigma-70 family RNA polymerase sigma factor [Candidatus Wallbacteria bacterium]